MRKACLGVIGALTLTVLLPAASEDSMPAALRGLIREALERSPRLEAAVLRARAAQQAVSRAGVLPDPRITLGLMNLPVNSFALDQEPMTGKLISIMQMFPFPGKQALAADMAEFEAEAIGFQREETRNQLVSLVKQAYYGLYAIDRAVETVNSNQRWMEQLVTAAETRYAAGSGLQQDVLRAHVERTRLQDSRILWEEKRRAAAARLNALLDRAPDTRIEIPSDDLPVPAPPPSAPGVEQLEDSRPLLRAWLERINKAETAVDLSRRNFWPDFTLGASYSQRNNLSNGAELPDFFSATVSVNIPVFFKRKQKVEAAVKSLDLAALRSQYRDIVAGVHSEIESLRAAMQRSRKRALLYGEGILIQARQALESAMGGYRVGKVDFLTLINNWMMLQNDELQYQFALADYHKHSAGYELAVGASFPGSENEEMDP